MEETTPGNLAKRYTDQFGLISLPQLAAQTPEIIGAARLSVHICFQPERASTLLFAPSHMIVEVAGSVKIPHDQMTIAPVSVHLGYDSYPETMIDWATLREFAWKLESCHHLLYDCRCLEHEVSDGTETKTVTWLNPNWLDNPKEMYLIDEYARLIKRANLEHLLD